MLLDIGINIVLVWKRYYVREDYYQFPEEALKKPSAPNWQSDSISTEDGIEEELMLRTHPLKKLAVVSFIVEC